MKYMNRGQVTALALASGLAAVVLLFPPYVSCGRLLCGEDYVFYRSPPASDPALEYQALDTNFLGFELGLVLVVTAAALLLLSGSRTRRKIVLALCGASAALTALFAAFDWGPFTMDSLLAVVFMVPSAVGILALAGLQLRGLPRPPPGGRSRAAADERVWPPPPNGV
ncbi:MAG: hypothetical protein JO250_24805 [Armatimonadetes bacterium]|nr:hypothetical protein [Armatimonadota bacterium]